MRSNLVPAHPSESGSRQIPFSDQQRQKVAAKVGVKEEVVVASVVVGVEADEVEGVALAAAGVEEVAAPVPIARVRRTFLSISGRASKWWRNHTDGMK
jgi:hypothetical protein